MIYTSYYANIKKIEKENIIPVGISLIIPEWFYGISYNKIAPTYEILRTVKCNNPDYNKYINEYSKHLMRLNVYDVLKDLNDIGKGNDIALLCYETPDKFCHRHILSDWVKYYTNIKIEEYVRGEKNNFKKLF